MISAINQSTYGIQQGVSGLAKAAGEIAHATVDKQQSVDSSLIDLKINETQTAVSAKSLAAADGNIGTLLDIMA